MNEKLFQHGISLRLHNKSDSADEPVIIKSCPELAALVAVAFFYSFKVGLFVKGQSDVVLAVLNAQNEVDNFIVILAAIGFNMYHFPTPTYIFSISSTRMRLFTSSRGRLLI